MDENKNSQYVILPKKDTLLQKYEILIYVCIRRHMNAVSMEAWPSIDTIVKDSGCSKPTVIKTIDTIEEKGYFKRIPKSQSKTKPKPKGRGCVYVFNNAKHFEPFSYDFLDNTSLTKSEKLQILCTQQYMIIDETAHLGKVSYSDRELSELSGLDYRTIKKNHETLIDKGFANQITLQTKDPITGLINKETIYHLDKIGQAIIFALRNHEERLCYVEDHQAIVDERLSRLEQLLEDKDKTIELLTRELNKKTKEQKSKDKIILNMPLNNQEGTGD